MRNTIYIFIIVLLFGGCSRVQRIADSEKRIRNVYKVDLSRDETYTHVLDWMAKNFKTTRETIHIKDRKRGKIVGRGLSHYHEYFGTFVKRPFSFLMTVQMKENRYRVTYSDMIIYYDERTREEAPLRFKQQYNNVKNRLDDLSRTLHEYLKGKASPATEEEEEDEDW